MIQQTLQFSPDLPRLSGHRAAIIERLAAGPATNGELSRVGGLRFGARLKELHIQMPHDIPCAHCGANCELGIIEVWAGKITFNGARSEDFGAEIEAYV